MLAKAAKSVLVGTEQGGKLERENKGMPETEYISGLTTSQVEQLCQESQIERTMYLLFSLNHWAKARERLFYVDRQGLYLVKGAILRRAFTVGALTVHSYIDGIEGFGTELAFDIAADIAAEGYLWRLEELVTPPLSQQEDLYDCIVRQLYTKMTGREAISADVVEELEAMQVREYILDRLLDLERQARATRQPIPCEALRDLCVAPCDLLSIQDRRYYDLGSWDGWDQLDESDLRKLDPEGFSLITFSYASPNARYLFHLPLRLAEAFVPGKLIEQLKRVPGTSRESGEYYGRAVTEAESLQHPILDILNELDVNIAAICPRQLSDKEALIQAQSMCSLAWRGGVDFADEDADEDEDDDKLDTRFWLGVHRPASTRKPRQARVHLLSDACPLCSELICLAPGPARLEHWQEKHCDQELTFSQASWVLNREIGKLEFCQQYPPDYRTPHERGWGTRYWKMETLVKWVQEREKSGTPASNAGACETASTTEVPD